MTMENPLATRSGTELTDVVGPPQPAPQKQINLFHALHTLLRGRYHWAILLAVLGAAVGAPLGYFSKVPRYQSIGIVRVHPILPRILYQTEQSSIMPMFEAFISSQVALIQSRRVVSDAMGQPEWKAFGRGLEPQAVAEFEKSLRVGVTRGAALIQVSFTDKDPKAAAAAVKCVIRSYERVYAESESDSGVPTMTLLETRRIDLTSKLNSINDRILAIANDFGSSSLQQVYDFKLSELNRVESQLRSAEIQLLLATARRPTTAEADELPSDRTAEMLAERDQRMIDLRRERDAIDREMRANTARLGASHPTVADAKVRLDVLGEDIRRRMEEIKAAIEGMSGAALASIPEAAQFNIEELKLQEAALRKLHAELKTDTVDLGRKNLEIERLRIEAAEVRDRLADTKNRIEALNLEKNVSGRITIMSYGDVPYLPESDKRVSMAIVGGGGLASVGVGVVLLMGLLDRRMRHIDTARSRLHQVDRLLGVIPELHTDLTDPNEASSVAHCVHHIRAMLQIRQRATGHKCFALTSPSPGDGKTSVATTVGMSLASSGCNTLLIDCDMEGAGLSSRLGRRARRPLGQVLLDLKLLGEAKLEEALRLSQSRGMLLGQAILLLGYLNEDQLAEALRHQGNAAPGLGDILCGEPVERAIATTGYPLLSILPLGVPARTHAGRLSPEALRRVLDQVSRKFDIVLIDCGPILGSVEASIVAAEADGVVLVVSRGGDRTAAENAVNFLLSAGAEIEGIIFNRAQTADVAASKYHSSTSMRSVRVALGVKPSESTQTDPFGGERKEAQP